MTKPIGAIILAAGFSRRFGSTKLLAELNNGNKVIEQTIGNISEAIPDFKIITRQEIATQLPKYESDCVIFDDAKAGLGASLAFAATLIGDWSGALICLADMPFISASAYRLVAERLHENNIVVPTFGGRYGNPVGFGNMYFPKLADLTGDMGAREIVKASSHVVIELELPEQAILWDIDTESDLEKYQALCQR